MTKEELAAKLNGREYTEEITRKEEAEASDSGLIVIFGASDDLCEFRGVIHDEVDCCDGGDILIHSTDVLPRNHEDCDCLFCGYDVVAVQCAKIEAVWSKGGYSWNYKTTLPNATFEIVEGAEKYCRGMVIDVKDLPTI